MTVRASAFAVAAVLAMASSAQAQPVIDLGAGVVVPVAEDDWENAIDPSFMLSFKAGAFTSPTLAVLGSIDYAPLDGPGGNNVSFSRLRIMGHAMFASR